MNNIRILIVLLLLFAPIPLIGQNTCLPNGLVLTNQDVATHFAANYPGCTVIQGDVILGGAINFIGMEQLVEIQGNIRCGGDGECNGSNGQAHEDFKGLENVISIGGILLEEHATGLESLESITGNLRLDECTFLNFEPLYELSQIGGDLYTSETNFHSFLGLNNLSTVGGDFHIDENLILENSQFISSLNSVGGSLYLSDCETLGDLNGFSGLTSIGTHLTIDDCPVLTSLDGLDNTSEINGELILRNNNILADISGIANINSQGVSFLELQNNPILTSCAVTSVCNHLLANGTNDINLNSIGCASAQEVIDQCLSTNLAGLDQQNFDLLNTLVENHLNVINPEGLEFVIRDGLGKVLKQSSLSGLIPVTELSSGIYFLNTMEDSKKLSVCEIINQNLLTNKRHYML